jgi:hypothetical protein
MIQGIEFVDPEKYPYLYALQERMCIEQEEEIIYRLEVIRCKSIILKTLTTGKL